MNTDKILDRLEALERAATRGPWAPSGEKIEVRVAPFGGSGCWACAEGRHLVSESPESEADDGWTTHVHLVETHHIESTRVSITGDKQSAQSGILTDADTQWIAGTRDITARLIEAARAILAMEHNDWCCTRGCRGYPHCGNKSRMQPGETCGSTNCTCYLRGPILAITKALTD